MKEERVRDLFIPPFHQNALIAGSYIDGSLCTQQTLSLTSNVERLFANVRECFGSWQKHKLYYTTYNCMI